MQKRKKFRAGDIHMKTLFKIGEIAELFHVNVKTLRYYDEIDLVKPEKIDDETGYRYYSTDQFEQLNTVRYLRELDVPLTEIRQFLDNRETDRIEGILKAQIRQAEEKKQQLDTIQKKLNNRLKQIGEAKAGAKSIPEIKRFPARTALLLKYSVRPDSDLEYPIRLLAQNVPTAVVFLGKVGLSIDQDNLSAEKYDEYDSIFLLLDEEETIEGIQESVKTVRFRAGTYARILYQGTHRQALSNYRTLAEYIRAEGYEICGSSLEITLIDSGFTTDETQYVTEIQIPVKKNK